MAKDYKVSSYPLMSDRNLQILLRKLAKEGGDHTITHVFVDPARKNEDDALVVVRVPDAAGGNP